MRSIRYAPLIFVLLAIVCALIPASALAQDDKYFQQDEGRQIPFGEGGSSLMESYTFWDWMYYGVGYADWWVEPALYNQGYPQAAISNWQTAIPYLQWRESSEAYADFKFKIDIWGILSVYNWIGGVFFDTTMLPDWGSTWEDDFTRNAAYLDSAIVLINYLDYNWAPGAQVGNLAHEIGHLCGLDDQYLPNGGCNPNVESIMDGSIASDPPTIPPTIIGKCDGSYSPSATDIANVNAYWNDGSAGDMTPYVNGTVLELAWDDRAWAEYCWGAYFRYAWWDGYTWQYEWLDVEWVFDQIGMHEDTDHFAGNPHRSIGTSFDRTTYGKPAGWYGIGVWPWNTQTASWGDYKFSDWQWIN